jgi:hypothetical protein
MPPDQGAPIPVEEAPTEERLESWKEIASYLGRGVTTVQRWEQDEGLPVHRLAHAKKGSVFAYKREVDSWRRSRTLPVAERTIPAPFPQAALTVDREPGDEVRQAARTRGPAVLVVAASLSILTIGPRGPS